MNLEHVGPRREPLVFFAKAKRPNSAPNWTVSRRWPKGGRRSSGVNHEAITSVPSSTAANCRVAVTLVTPDAKTFGKGDRAALPVANGIMMGFTLATYAGRHGMNHHLAFFKHLGGLPEGPRLQEAYRAYKSATDASAFALNGLLKGGGAIPAELQELARTLPRVICARNREPLTIYRITSDHEFSGPLLPLLLGGEIRYPAYLSACGREAGLHPFAPANGRPLILDISCPAGTPMALMEAGDGGEGLEDEYLLGAGTRFTPGEAKQLVESDIHALGLVPDEREVWRLPLTVVGHPPYTEHNTFFDFH